MVGLPKSLSKITLSRSLFEALLSELLQSPVERAALLFGSVEGDRAVVSSGVVAVNEEESPTHFRVDPTFLLRVLEEADARGEEFVGLLHVHPAPPEPSEEDLEYMEINPVVWIIVSRSGEYVAYQLLSGELRGVEIELT